MIAWIKLHPEIVVCIIGAWFAPQNVRQHDWALFLKLLTLFGATDFGASNHVFGI